MHIFIDGISPISKFIVFDRGRILAETTESDIAGREYDALAESFLKFLSDGGYSLDDVEGIVVVNGPGGFTGTRIITLVFNTISLIRKIPLMPIDYFRMLELAEKPFPVIIRANRSECLLKEHAGDEPRLISKDEVTAGSYSGIGNEHDFEGKDIRLNRIDEYGTVIKNLVFFGKLDRIEPFYIKKPNIT